MTFKTGCLNSCSTKMMLENADVVFLMKAQVTRKRVILHKSFFMNYAWGKCWKLMAMFHLLKIRTSIDIFKNEKCKVTFGLVYSNKLEFNIVTLEFSMGYTSFFYLKKCHFHNRKFHSIFHRYINTMRRKLRYSGTSELFKEHA